MSEGLVCHDLCGGTGIAIGQRAGGGIALLEQGGKQRAIGHVARARRKGIKLGAQLQLESAFVQWLLCCFVVGMPMETTLRIWDCLLCGDGNIVLLRFSIALLKQNEAELLATTSAES
ncbi:MAG TPA: hypothetical protein PKE25_04225, partial [Novosphingobium sp.]|nr:hypothetical protein [Novosphingobium sp.]